MDRTYYPRGAGSLEVVARRVSDCLAYEGMMAIPEHFESFSLADHRRRSRLHPELNWEDACPAYALALATHDAYEGHWNLAVDDELEAQWDELRGVSTMEWPVARLIVREAWSWLSQREGALEPVRH